MRKEKELLRKQMELLAEQPKSAVENELWALTCGMCKVYALIKGDTIFTALLSAIGVKLTADFLIRIGKKGEK